MSFDLDLLWIAKCNYCPKHLIKRNCHDYYQVVFVLNGEGKITVSDDLYHVSANEVYIIKPNVEHSIEASRYKSLNIIELKFNCYNIRSKNMLDHLPARLNNVGNSIKFSFINIVDEIEIQDEYTDQMINTLITQIFCSLLRISDIEKSDLTYNIPKDAIHINNHDKSLRYLDEVIDYIRNNYCDEIKLQDLADIAYLSPIYFSSAFKEQYGVSPIQYLQSIRCEVAKTMLAETKDTITSISEKVGFQSIYYFSRAFKKYEGMSPNEYRSRNQDFVIKDFRGDITDFS